MLTRFILAVAASSAILVMAAILGFWVGGVSSGQPVLKSAEAVFTHLWFFIALFGLPICVVLSGILGGAMLMIER